MSANIPVTTVFIKPPHLHIDQRWVPAFAGTTKDLLVDI